jgi:hypothetical protein
LPWRRTLVSLGLANWLTGHLVDGRALVIGAFTVEA